MRNDLEHHRFGALATAPGEAAARLLCVSALEAKAAMTASGSSMILVGFGHALDRNPDK